jgi:hypothetical protein
MSGVAQTYCVCSVFMCNWCLELFRLIMSCLCSCVTYVWSCSYLLCLVCVHVYLMSGVAQTYCVLSEFMCSWCLELFRLVMSGLCSCVSDVWSCSDLLCPLPDIRYTWTQRGHNKSEQLQTSVTHELREDTLSLSNSRHQVHMNTDQT